MNFLSLVMNRTRFLSFVAVCLGSWWVATLAQAQAPDAERTAKIYLSAFFSGDVKAAANLTDPRTLERIRESFLADLLKADPQAEKAILANFGAGATTAKLSQMDTRSLYVAVTEAEHRRNPAVVEAMKQTRFKVLGSAPNPSGGVTVRFTITTPGDGKTTPKDSGLMMRQVQGEWKVVGHVPS
jgi:hypothetical protein